MTVTSASTESRQALKAVIAAEFADEGFPIRDDRLHGSLGWEGTVIGLYPARQSPMGTNYLVMNTEIVVQFYGKWKKEIDPETRVDPARIENYAERFLRAVRDADPMTTYTWYFTVEEISYPPDPTGNITRFEARVTAKGDNTSILETTG